MIASPGWPGPAWIFALLASTPWHYDTGIRVEVSATGRDACDRSRSATFTDVVDPSPVESSG